MRDEFKEEVWPVWDALPEELQIEFMKAWKPVEFEYNSGPEHDYCKRCGAMVGQFEQTLHAKYHNTISLVLWVVTGSNRDMGESLKKIGAGIAEILDGLD